jgi:hypothetical protein
MQRYKAKSIELHYSNINKPPHRTLDKRRFFLHRANLATEVLVQKADTMPLNNLGNKEEKKAE